MTEDRIVIRASSTSSYPDCPRREATKIFGRQIEAAGYQLNPRRNHIGAVVGTGVHGGMGASLTHKMMHGDMVDEETAIGAGITAMRTSMEQEGEIVWDGVTPEANTAEQQVIRGVKAFRSYCAPRIDPQLVELRFEATYQGRYVISGQPDYFTKDGTLGDLKNGKTRRENGPQYGVYSLLLGSQEEPIQVKQMVENFIPRVDLRKAPPVPQAVAYQLEVAEERAHHVLGLIVQHYEEFERTGDRWAFPSNPSSMLCSPKYCPAFGTSFCREHKT